MNSSEIFSHVSERLNSSETFQTYSEHFRHIQNIFRNDLFGFRKIQTPKSVLRWIQIAFRENQNISVVIQNFFSMRVPLSSNCTSKSFFSNNTLNAQAVVLLNRENEDRISEGFDSTFLNRSSIKMLAINQKKKKKKKKFFFFFFFFTFFFFFFFTNKKRGAAPFS